MTHHSVWVWDHEDPSGPLFGDWPLWSLRHDPLRRAIVRALMEWRA